MFEYLFCLNLINVALYQSIFFPLEGSFPPILYKKESLEFALSIIRILKCMVALWKLYLRALLQYKLINWI